MYLVLFSIVLYRTIVTVYTDNIVFYNYLRQMPQIIHLSPVGCFTPARGKTEQKNRKVSGVKLLDRAVSGARFLTGVCLNVTFLIVDPWQSCVCFIRSGVTRCTLFMVLSLDRMCQRLLHAVLSSHIGTLIHRLAAEPCSTAGLLFHFRCPSGTILLTPFSMV